MRRQGLVFHSIGGKHIPTSLLILIITTISITIRIHCITLLVEILLPGLTVSLCNNSVSTKATVTEVTICKTIIMHCLAKLQDLLTNVLVNVPLKHDNLKSPKNGLVS